MGVLQITFSLRVFGIPCTLLVPAFLFGALGDQANEPTHRHSSLYILRSACDYLSTSEQRDSKSLGVKSASESHATAGSRCVVFYGVFVRCES